VSSTTLTIGGTNGTSTQSYAGSLTSGTLNIGNSQTNGILNIGTNARSGAINVATVTGSTCPINILNGDGATTGGSVNIANGTLQTTTVNIASGTGTGAVTIGNVSNTVNINGTLTMGTGRNITLQPAASYIIPAVNQLGYTYYAFLSANVNVPASSNPAGAQTLLTIANVPVGTYYASWQYRLMNTNATGSSVTFTMGHLTVTTPYVQPSGIKTPKYSAISIQNYTQAVSSTSGSGNNQSNNGSCTIQVPSIQSIDLTTKVTYTTPGGGGTLQFSALDGDGFPNTYLILTKIA
jgi:hypothetical protein